MPPAADLEVREGTALGSRLRLLAPADSAIDAAWTAVRAEFAAVDQAMSRFRDDSEVTRLNRRGHAGALSPRLRQALLLTERARRVTDGRFDPRVLRDLERLGFDGVVIEAGDGRGAREGATAGPRRDARVLECRRGTWVISAPVDLGGIGKGLALRWAAAVAARALAGAGFLIDAGGDIATAGPAPAAPPHPELPPGWWSIAIEDPHGGDEPLATCALAGGQAMATSSVRVGTLARAGGPVHHLVDPSTGRPGGEGLLAVTVAGPDPAWAEVWSKALFLAGAGAIAAEARRRGLAAWWVETSGELSMTPAARAATTWVRSEARRAALSLP